MPPHLLRRVVERLLEGLLRALRPSHVSCKSRGLQRGRSRSGHRSLARGAPQGLIGPHEGDAGSGVIYLDAHLHLAYDATVPSWLGASRARYWRAWPDLGILCDSNLARWMVAKEGLFT